MNLTVDRSSTLSPMDLRMPRSRGRVIAFWSVTALFCLQTGFTAYAQLVLPQVAAAFTQLGFPDYFRVELSLAKFLGVVLLLGAGAGSGQRVDLRRLRHHPWLCAHCPPLGR
jgi:DoxX-like family